MMRNISSLIVLIGVFAFSLLAQSPTEVATVAFVTQKGKAFKALLPDKKLFPGSKLFAGDKIRLEDGVQIRVVYNHLQKSKKYQAPAEISINKEIKKLDEVSKDSGIISRIIHEIGNLYQQYVAPKYNKHAAVRGLTIASECKIHDYSLSYLRRPHFILHSNHPPQTLTLYKSHNNSPGDKLGEIQVKAGQTIVRLPMEFPDLDFGKNYFWTLSGEQTPGRLTISSEKEAQRIKSIIKTLQKEAINEIEASQAVAAFLFKAGFWSEAYVHGENGLRLSRNNQTLRTLQAAVLSTRPDDSAFQKLISQSGELTVNYSFHIKEGSKTKEIYHGSRIQTGQMMQIRIKSDTDGYIFILNFDSANKLYVLYPLVGEDHFLKGGSEIVMPAKGQYFQADNQVGEEKLFLIASKVPLDYLALELDKYLIQPEKKRGNFSTQEEFTNRGFSAIVDQKGMERQDLKPGISKFQLSRLLKGKGLLVKEIKFLHQ